MHRTWGLIALVVCTVLVGCTAAPNIDYRAALPGETTRTSGLSETTLTPVAFKAAPKTDTPIARASAAAGTDGSTPSAGSFRASGSVIPSTPDSSGAAKITVKVTTAAGAPIGGAKVVVTVHYSQVMSDNKDSQTYSCTTNSGGFASTTIDASPFNRPTMIQTSIKATVAGQSSFFIGPSFTTG